MPSDSPREDSLAKVVEEFVEKLDQGDGYRTRNRQVVKSEGDVLCALTMRVRAYTAIETIARPGHMRLVVIGIQTPIAAGGEVDLEVRIVSCCWMRGNESLCVHTCMRMVSHWTSKNEFLWS